MKYNDNGTIKEIYVRSVAPSLEIDDTLSDSSENPVQNKVITNALNSKGTYNKPSTGIPKADLANDVQASLDKADTALQSHQTITSNMVTGALGYTPYDSANPNGYTSNTGTITGITMNGASKGTSGVVNLGTVLTAHQDISGKQNKLTASTGISIDSSNNISVNFGTTASTACVGNDIRLSDSRTPTSHRSTGTTYGVGSTTYYGHCKTINNLTTSSHTDGYALSAYQGYLLNNAISNIIDSGSNENGNYIKFSNGTMICCKTVHKTDVDMSHPWGALYETVSAVEFGDFPQAFIEKPFVAVTKTDGAGIMHEGIGSISATSAGSTYFCSPINRPSINFYVDIIAIGRWK